MTTRWATGGAIRGMRPPPWLTVGLAVAAFDLGIVLAALVLGGPLLAIGAIAASGAVLLFFRFPGVLFAAYLLLAFYKGGVQPFLPVDITLAIGFLNTLQLIVVVRDRRRRAVSTAGIVLWTALSVLILAGVWYAPDQDLAMDRAIRWWTLVFPPILGGGLRVGSNPRYLREFLWAFFVMGAITVGLGLTQLSGDERLTVLNTNTIQVARAALLVPLLGLTFVPRERFFVPPGVLLGAIPAALIVALASGSRGPLLFFGLLAAVGAIRYFAHPTKVDWRRIALIALLVGASGLALSIASVSLPSTALDRFTLFGDFVEEGLTGSLTTSVGDTSAGNRIVLFRAAESMFADHPLLGVGTSGFEALAPRYMSPDEVEAWPHNAFLQAAAEFGVVGLGITLALLALVAIRRLPPGHAANGLRLTFVFFFLNAMVSGDIFSDRETWGLLMLVLLVDAGTAPARVATQVRGRLLPSAPRPALAPGRA